MKPEGITDRGHCVLQAPHHFLGVLQLGDEILLLAWLQVREELVGLFFTDAAVGEFRNERGIESDLYHWNNLRVIPVRLLGRSRDWQCGPGRLVAISTEAL